MNAHYLFKSGEDFVGRDNQLDGTSCSLSYGLIIFVCRFDEVTENPGRCSGSTLCARKKDLMDAEGVDTIYRKALTVEKGGPNFKRRNISKTTTQTLIQSEPTARSTSNVRKSTTSKYNSQGPAGTHTHTLLNKED